MKRFALIIAALVGCSASQIKADEAEAGYLAQQLQCVDQYPDRPSIDACRAKVRAKWMHDAGITETVTDAGRDQ